MKKSAHIPLHPNEKLLKSYRETELVLLKPAALVLILIFTPWYFLVKYELEFDYGKLLALWTLGVSIYAFKNYALWYLKQYIITDQRLVHISHFGLFKKRVIETPLERVLNVSFKTTGILSSVFGYGDVEVQVVGLLEPILLKNIRQPEKIKDYLWNLHSKFHSGEKQMDQNDIPTLQEKIGYEKSNKLK